MLSSVMGTFALEQPFLHNLPPKQNAYETNCRGWWEDQFVLFSILQEASRKVASGLVGLWKMFSFDMEVR